MRDSHWGADAEVRITALASRLGEGAVWQFETTGFKDGAVFTCMMAPTRKIKMKREGDLGLVPLEYYEADDAAGKTTVVRWKAGGKSFLTFDNPDVLDVCNEREGQARMDQEQHLLQDVVSTLQFTTPDPFINTLGSNLAAASDGLWDGDTETWLHGCIGWRMPLAGWRAAYLADALGWNDKAKKHFDAYANSQVRDVAPVYPHPSQDSAKNLCRAVEKWGTQMYSNGYICRNPNNSKKMHHYDMNLNYVDELLWHFSYDADKEYLRKMWPTLKLHLEWEKRNWDPDGDHLYDAYCCIWASDALYYNGGAVTHSSAYNYRGNLLAARIAELIGEDPNPYRKEAAAILNAMNERLWVKDEGHWAEFQDLMGEKRLHKNAALWTIYTPIDCGVGTPMQKYQATRYVDNHIPHIPVEYIVPEKYAKATANLKSLHDTYYTLSTTDWMPYDWSTNNVAHEEVMNMALAYFEAGRSDSGYNLLMADLLDEQYLGKSPGNFGQISYYDKARSEAYRDFGDNVGISARTIVNGLFGVQPDALNGRCVLQPAWPESWDSVEFRSPYLTYRYIRKGNVDTYEIEQHFSQPLQMVVSAKVTDGQFMQFAGTADSVQTIIVDHSLMKPQHIDVPEYKERDITSMEYMAMMGLTDSDNPKAKYEQVDIKRYMNSNVDDIFKNEYLSPRSPYTTLEIPKQGIGEWCLPAKTAHIEDDGLRNCVTNGLFDTHVSGVKFLSPKEGRNVAYTSLWDNYPDSITIPLKGKAQSAWLMMAGSTNNMQSRIANGVVTVEYTDGTTTVMPLENPVNWCPIEQDYYTDEYAFRVSPLTPYRIHLATGKVSRNLSKDIQLAGIGNPYNDNPDSAEGNIIPDGAAQMLRLPLDGTKRLKSLTLRTMSNDVVIGLMGVTLER